MAPSHLTPLVVLATPEMIRLIKEASTIAVQPALDDSGQTTVGTHVDVAHERPGLRSARASRRR